MKGLIAALAALPAAWAAHWAGGLPAVASLAVLGFALAVTRPGASARADRFAGQVLALCALSGGLWFAGVAPHVFPWPGVVGGFVICQAVTWGAARLGAGPLADDAIGGAVAAALALAGAAIAHGWFA